MKKRLNKRGVAMELAVVTLLTIFGLCLILLTISQLSGDFNAKTDKAVENRIKLDEIAETYVLYREDFNPAIYRDHRISIAHFSGGTRMTATRSSAPYSSVTVEINDSGEIIRWSYH